MSADIADECGISYRNLDYWTRRGYLRPERARTGSGNRRRWPQEELRVAREMGALTKAGMSPEAAAKAAREGRTAGILAALAEGGEPDVA